MNEKGAKAETGYTDGEGAALIAPMIGFEPGDLAQYIMLGFSPAGWLGFGASSGIDSSALPGILRVCADVIEKEIKDPE